MSRTLAQAPVRQEGLGRLPRSGARKDSVGTSIFIYVADWGRETKYSASLKVSDTWAVRQARLRNGCRGESRATGVSLAANVFVPFLVPRAKDGVVRMMRRERSDPQDAAATAPVSKDTMSSRYGASNMLCPSGPHISV